ncbi:MAG: complex I subunit 4 family protein, partial [Bacillota bacterium]
MQYLLVLLLVVPILGAIGCALVREARAAKVVALFASLIDAGLALALLVGYDWKAAGIQYSINLGTISAAGFSFKLGTDAISLWLVALTTFLQPLAIAASFQSIQQRQKEYYGWMLVLLAAMLGVFIAQDALLFYVFFELTLVPMFFIIGIWGGPERRYAAAKFFLFTFAGSVFTLAAIIYLGVRVRSFEIPTMVAAVQKGMLSHTELWWIVLGFLVGFSVKVPLFPLHTWLPLAHTEAPTAGSVILAGVLLKLGTYGILRLALPIGFVHAATGSVLFPTLIQIIGLLCVIGVIYGALVAWVQQDIKKLVAYSSVSHLGLCVLGIAAMNYEGVQGSILYMINHGLSTGAMFLVVGMIYDRYHTRDINELSGLAKQMPVMAFFFVLFVLSSIGLPGLNGFPSEFLTILGAFRSQYLGIIFGAFAAMGIILGAIYMLHMTARVIWGPLKTPANHEHEGHDPAQAATPGHGQSVSALPMDLSPREVSVLVPLAIAVVIIGVIPAKLLNSYYRPVQQLIGNVDS